MIKLGVTGIRTRCRAILLALAMAPAGLSAASTCVVGATDFSTETTLCDPQLSDDTLGWFGQTVGTTLGTLCKNSY